jgi:hypothetical protein
METKMSSELEKSWSGELDDRHIILDSEDVQNKKSARFLNSTRKKVGATFALLVFLVAVIVVIYVMTKSKDSVDVDGEETETHVSGVPSDSWTGKLYSVSQDTFLSPFPDAPNKKFNSVNESNAQAYTYNAEDGRISVMRAADTLYLGLTNTNPSAGNGVLHKAWSESLNQKWNVMTTDTPGIYTISSNILSADDTQLNWTKGETGNMILQPYIADNLNQKFKIVAM